MTPYEISHGYHHWQLEWLMREPSRAKYEPLLVWTENLKHWEARCRISGLQATRFEICSRLNCMAMVHLIVAWKMEHGDEPD